MTSAIILCTIDSKHCVTSKFVAAAMEFPGPCMVKAQSSTRLYYAENRVSLYEFHSIFYSIEYR